MSKEEPVEFEVPEAWTEGEYIKWQATAYAAIRVCAEEMDVFTTKQVWWLVDNPPERRAMLVAVNKAVKDGIIKREGNLEAYKDVYQTRDGHKWKQNKVVKQYRSLIR